MRHVPAAAALLAVLAAASAPSFAQAPAQGAGQQPAASSAAQELYHVHIVKAAPGKWREMVDSYINAPVDPNATAPPLVLRHVQGDDWDLLVLTPLGKEGRITLAASAADQQFVQRTRGLRAQHSDTFAVGPRWTETRAALAGPASDPAVVATAGTSAARNTGVYIVTMYRAVPGHRDQLEQTVRKIAALNPGRYITMQHLEGSPWDLISVQRFDSWAAFAEDEENPDMERLRAQGFTSPDGPSLELREHVAEHHDTIAVRVERPVK